MDVSVIVVSYNVRELLARCLDSLAAAAGDGLTWEVIVVDNGSADGSAGLVAERYPDATLVPLGENRGFSYAINRGAALARGELLLLLNPDAELLPRTLAEMRRRLKDGTEFDALGVRQIDEQGFFQLAVGPGPSLVLETVRKIVQGRLDRRDRRVARGVDRILSRPRVVPWVAASCLLVRRTAFFAVGGFDESFFLYFEDIDFCLRLGAAGHAVLYEPSITIVHHRGASASKNRAVARKAYRESQARFWSKHRSGWVRWLVSTYIAARGRISPER